MKIRKLSLLLVIFVEVLISSNMKIGYIDSNKIMSEFHPAGFLISDNISMKKFNEFLQKQKSYFELLANEYIKKINQYEKLSKN